MHLKVGDVHVDVQAHLDAVRSDEFWQFAAQTWYELYAPYVPWNTGALYTKVIVEPGVIRHLVSYAQKVYEGDFNYRKDVHPFASRMWDQAAVPVQLPNLIAAMQAYVDEGRLKIGESDDP